MTFYITWSGLGHDLAESTDLAQFTSHGAPVTHGRIASSEPDAASIIYAAQVVGLLKAWGALHPDQQVQITASGHAQPIDTGAHRTLSLSLTTTPSLSPPEPESPALGGYSMFGTLVSGERIDQGFDPKERTVDSSISHDPWAPEPERTASPSVAADTPQPEPVEEPAPDPSVEPSPDSESPGEPAGPTEAEPQPVPTPEEPEPVEETGPESTEPE